jgi:hypothetical protein
MRGDTRSPATSTKPYVEWERGPVTATTVEQMTGWVDTSMKTGAWLVLVIHGVDGVGYQPLPAANLKALFDDIKTTSDRVWVATYQDGAKYIRERMKALELLAKLAGLFDRPQEEAKPEPLAVRFVETDGAEG